MTCVTPHREVMPPRSLWPVWRARQKAWLRRGACTDCNAEWALALQYLSTHPRLLESSWADNQCQNTVSDLVDERPGGDPEHLEGARKVWLIGHRCPVQRRPLGRQGQLSAEHRVVMTAGGCLIDLTRRQYDPHGSVPTHYGSLDEAGRHWRWATLHERSDHDYFPLPDLFAPSRFGASSKHIADTAEWPGPLSVDRRFR
jgi:hypothetical protein